MNTFIVTNANDCPSLLSYGATFRMGVLLPNYPQDIVVKGENVPHFSKMSGGNTGNGTSNGTSNSMSNMFQILNDIWKRQRAVQCQYDYSTISTVLESASPFRTTTPSAPASTTATVQQANPVHGELKYFMEWTSSILCTCPQTATSDSQTQRIISLEKSPAPVQWKDFCEQTPIDEARHSVTLIQLL